MRRYALLVLVVAVTACLAVGQPPAPVPGISTEIQWAVIGDPDNPAYEGGPTGTFAGRGSVSYDYRISKYEVTSAQWLEFINIFAPQSPNPNSFLRPSWSGLTPNFAMPPGYYTYRTDIENPEMVGVYGLTWREAAMYANWLHNGKSKRWLAIMNGAYNVRTFGPVPGGGFTDQLEHHPDARYWIPTLDEWIKAAHYDPNRFGPGEGGWWVYPHCSDEPPTPGEPGQGQTSAGVTDPVGFDNPKDIPLGSYPDVQSPWGLLDLSGGAHEWTEQWGTTTSGVPSARVVDGTRAGGKVEWSLDRVYTVNYLPWTGVLTGLRIAGRIEPSG